MNSLLPCLERVLENGLLNRAKSFKKFREKSPKKRIDRLEIVRRKTIYGMYLNEFLFVKIFLYDPNDIVRVASLLEVIN